DPDVHAVPLRSQKGELPPVGRDRCAANPRIIEEILERNAWSGLSSRSRCGSEDQEEKNSESKRSRVHFKSCLTKWGEHPFNTTKRNCLAQPGQRLTSKVTCAISSWKLR